MQQQTLDAFESTGEDTECPTCGESDFKSNLGMRIHHSQVHGESLSTETLNCENCGDEYKVAVRESDRSRYCSWDCKIDGQHGENHPNYTPTVSLECDNCGASLDRKEHNIFDTNFCDSDCMYAYQQGDSHHNFNSTVHACSHCGDDLLRCDARVGEIGPFCDHDCYSNWLSENRSGESHYAWDREEVECVNCGESLLRGQYQLDGRDHFCNYDCMFEYRQKNSVPASLTDAVRTRLSGSCWTAVARRYRKQNATKCRMCGDIPSRSDRLFDLHHIVPVVAGGSNADELLMPLCRKCHRKAETYTQRLPEVEPVLAEP